MDIRVARDTGIGHYGTGPRACSMRTPRRIWALVKNMGVSMGYSKQTEIEAKARTTLRNWRNANWSITLS